MRFRGPACFACITVMASLVASGCGETTIDSDKAETFISKTVTEQTGAKVKSVTCPDDIKGEKGGKFTCVVTATDGTKGDVAVVQTDGEGKVHISAPFLHVRQAETSIAEEVKKQTDVAVTVICPEIIVPKKDATFDCEGSDGSETHKIVLTTDASGAFTFKIQ